MQNPLANIKLQSWPDFVLAISGTAFLVSLPFVLGTCRAIALAVLFCGGFIFGLGGKIAHYRYRDSSVPGNANAWFPGWRHSLLADSLAMIGLVITFIGAYLFALIVLAHDEAFHAREMLECTCVV